MTHVTWAQEMRHTLAIVDELDAGHLGEQLTKYGVKAPDTGNELSAPFRFNLMFRTSIGPKGDQVGYLRPETAQGIFVNFRFAVPRGLPPAPKVCVPCPLDRLRRACLRFFKCADTLFKSV